MASSKQASLSEQSLQMRLDRRRGTLAEVDRGQFEKQQVECIQKAIKNEECPAKEKHVRRCIIGTWQERGNSMFWNCLGRQPLPSQVIMCWKALTVMHKMLREGHPNVLRDSYVYRKTLRDLFSVYRFQAGTYGPLVCQYLKILQSKLELHRKYPGIVGSLAFSEENPIKIPDKDINDVFTFAVECFDYQDLLLTLEESIFKTLDKGKNNSQIPTSQCRIAALVPVLKECSGMYDVLVYVMIKLHKSLPPDTLAGHRDRYFTQHKRLKLFCLETSNLQYVTNLMPIPNIPEQPEDFLIHKYEGKQRKEKPKEEPKPVQIAPQVDERDVLIEQLMREIDELREQLEYTEKMAKESENHLRMQIMRIQEELNNIERAAKQSHQENMFLKQQVEDHEKHLKEDSDAQEKAKTADEKFTKLKNMYAKLRQDHLVVLKKHTDVNQKEEAANLLVKKTEEKLKALQVEINSKDEELKSLKEDFEILEKANQSIKIDFDQSDQSSKDMIDNLSKEIESLKSSIKEAETKVKISANELEATRNLNEGQIQSLQEQLEQLSTGKITEETARKSAEDAINKLRDDNDELRATLSSELEDAKLALGDKENAYKELQETVQKLEERILDETNRLNSDLERLNLERDEEMNSRQNIEQEMSRLSREYEAKITNITADLQQTMELKEAEENARRNAEEEVVKSRTETEQQLIDKEKEKVEEELRTKYALLAATAADCEKIITTTMCLFDDSKHESGTTCTADYLKSRLDGLCASVDAITQHYQVFYSTHTEILPLVRQLNNTTHVLCDALIHGKATSHMGAVDESQNLVNLCKCIGASSLQFVGAFKSKDTDPDTIRQGNEDLNMHINKLIEYTQELIPKQSDSLEGVDNMVEEEMKATEQLVSDAAAKIEELMNKSRKHHSGLQLEVNERILDSCTGLMKAIRELILKSKDLQDEIVAEGRGSATAKEFYKRHNKWTEGLLSAAKSVGMGATLLVDAADKVIERKGKFEELVVVSHEISASTAQLVAASRVKASNNSKRLPPLMAASKEVGNATAGVVAAVRSGAESTEEAKIQPDYSKLSLTQTKRFEMDCQVKILELEDTLSKERQKLGKLRKAHYQLAVELYGEEEVNLPQ